MHNPSLASQSTIAARAHSPVSYAPWHVDTENAPLAAQFVRLCGSVTLSSDSANRLRALSVELSADEWRQVIHFAETEGMSALVFHHMAQLGLLTSAPANVTASLAASYQQALVTNSSLLRAQQAIISTLSSNGIQAIPLKGPSLALRLYGNLGLRPINDIDLLIRRRDIARLDQILQRHGYHPLGARAKWMGYAALLHADLAYRAPQGAKIEMHWELTHQPIYRIGLRANSAWVRTRILTLMGNNMPCLDAADELRFLCLHCTVDHRLTMGHPMELARIRLIWLVDIAQLIQSLPADWSWSTFTNETIALRLATPILIALAHCQAYLDLHVPPRVMDLLLEAALTPAERRAWTISQGGVATTENIQAHLANAHGIGQVAEVVKGALIPDPDWIRLRHGRHDSRGLSLMRAYVRYYLHVLRRLPEVFS
jgi:hypothetical protein